MSFKELKSIIKINDFTDIEADLEIDIEQNWFKEILADLEKEVQSEDMPDHKGDLYTHLRIKRLKNTEFKDHLVIRGRITSAYTANCIRCLTPTDGEIDTEFSTVFLHSHFDSAEEYKEVTHIFCDKEEMELCFHDKGNIDLKELLHDQVFMNLDHLPLHHEDCKGLCQQCGVDLNLEVCECVAL